MKIATLMSVIDWHVLSAGTVRLQFSKRYIVRNVKRLALNNRLFCVFRHVDININDKVKVNNFNFIYSPKEIKILKKISEWPKCIETSIKNLEPHRVPTYLYELSSEFHSYWNLGRDDKSKRFIGDNNKISLDKLILLKSISIVIASGMNILGVDTPEKM